MKLSIWVAGEWLETDEKITVTNKFTGEVMTQVSVATHEHIRKAVSSAQRAMKDQPLSTEERYRILSTVSRLLMERQDELGLQMAEEAGKPLKEARMEVSRAAKTFLIAAEEAKRIHGEIVPLSSDQPIGKLAYTLRLPIGVVCAISPFNFPMNLVAHKIAPAIAAGNAFVLKPASYTPLSAISLVKLMEEAGLPVGYGHLVIGGGSTVGEWLLQEEGFAYYTFTGSPAVGKHIKSAVGLRRSTLELGSNSATIVHSDADLDYAAERCARTAFNNAGQICISVQRIYVQESVYETFITKLIKVTESLKVGDPTQPDTDVGPMISVNEAERAESWIQEAVENGAKLLLGGKRTGALITPTILTGVTDSCRVCKEEAFAPLVMVNAYDTIQEAIQQVNASSYGLQGGLFTNSIDIMLQGMREIEVGGLMINETSSFRSDEMPYGGVKDSGVGREGPRFAIEEMTEVKLVVVHK
jgi:acyl-CoA reductase-like NAD-dependent aldehyde dehydrogenase